jgi:hypothetical protein
LSYPRKRVSMLFCRRGFPIKNFGNDKLTANLDSNDQSYELKPPFTRS